MKIYLLSIFCSVVLLVSCSGQKTQPGSGQSDGPHDKSCNYPLGRTIGLSNTQEVPKVCRKNPGKEFLQGYRSSILSRVRMDLKKCHSSADCLVKVACLDAQCVYSQKSCDFDYQCNVQWNCVSGSCESE